MNDHVDDFITEILKRWPPPGTWSAERKAAWGSDLGDELGNEKEDVLKYALKIMIRERTYPSTPMPSDVMKVVNQAVREVSAQRRAGMLKMGAGGTYEDGPFASKPEDRAWTSERVKLAYDMLKTEMAKTAAREGWVHNFWTFVIQYGRMPNDQEINAKTIGYVDRHAVPGLKEAARQHDEVMRNLAASTSPRDKHWYQYGQMMIARGQRLADIANGKRDVPSMAEYWEESFGKFERAMASAMAPAPPKYADESAAEGRGWKGLTA